MGLAGVVRSLAQSMGSDVNIFKRENETATPDFTVRALKNSKKGSKAVVFQFPDLCDLEVGDVIVLVGARDRWVVTETEDVVIQNRFSHLEAHVDKEGAKKVAPIHAHNVVYNLLGPNSRVNQSSVDNSSNVQVGGQSELMRLISDLREEIARLGLDAETQTEALETVEIIKSQAAAARPNKTVLSSMVTGLIKLLPHAANIATVGSAILDLL